MKFGILFVQANFGHAYLHGFVSYLVSINLGASVNMLVLMHICGHTINHFCYSTIKSHGGSNSLEESCVKFIRPKD